MLALEREPPGAGEKLRCQPTVWVFVKMTRRLNATDASQIVMLRRALTTWVLVGRKHSLHRGRKSPRTFYANLDQNEQKRSKLPVTSVFEDRGSFGGALGRITDTRL